jgi:hypothetical protein
VNQGRIIARKETSLGSTAVGTVVNPKAGLLFEARDAILPLNLAEPVTVNAGGTGLTTFVVDGKVNVTAPVVFNGRASQTTEATSAFVGTGDVTVTSTMNIVDHVRISGSNLNIAGNIVLSTAVAIPTSSLLISGDCVVSGQISGVLGVERHGNF